ncbi:outer membrane protein [Solimonas marina]|uniref:Porin family protein n=1 Tax=Solimonas marina TaxID=2714601 RepID=A0A969W8K2_9GAMM|nr:outer membrane beta-barrel protein [Solimonas marina]NKF21973.1 porin family protein [Solimonas marina]
MKGIRGSIAALAFAPGIALAAQPGFVDGYYIADSKLKLDVPGYGSGHDSGDGFGARLMAPIGKLAFVSAEYQSSNLDDSDIDIDQIRAGLGFMVGDQLRYGALAEYIHFKLDAGGGDSSTPDGYGLHGRLEYAPVPAATLYGQIGYVHLSDHGAADGVEWLVGAAYNFTPAFGAFVDYRSTDIEDNDNVDYTFEDLRLGLRWNFGVMQ